MSFLKEEIKLSLEEHNKVNSYTNNFYAVVLSFNYEDESNKLIIVKYYYTNIGFKVLTREIESPKVFYKNQGLKFIDNLPAVIEEYRIYHD